MFFTFFIKNLPAIFFFIIAFWLLGKMKDVVEGIKAAIDLGTYVFKMAMELLKSFMELINKNPIVTIWLFIGGSVLLVLGLTGYLEVVTATLALIHKIPMWIKAVQMGIALAVGGIFGLRYKTIPAAGIGFGIGLLSASLAAGGIIAGCWVRPIFRAFLCGIGMSYTPARCVAVLPVVLLGTLCCLAAVFIVTKMVEFLDASL